jgi:putative phosphoesterase
MVPRTEVVIGVISDTHGLLRPEALAALKGSDFIVHAGDVGSPEILGRLGRIAPVTAVRGNVDTDSWAASLPETAVLEAEGIALYIVHDLGEVDVDLRAGGFAAVISGHSHQPRSEWRNQVLYFNPGAAGPRRFRLPVTVGKLRIQETKIDAEIIPLLPDGHR